MSGVKVEFKKKQDGKTYVSDAYYESEEDFKILNPTLIFNKLTNKTKPIPKKREA